MERLQKIIAKRGICSRRKAEQYITERLVKVNGQIVDELGQKFPEDVTITVDGLDLTNQANEEEKHSFLFYKPKKVLSTVSDDRDRTTVVSYFKNQDLRLFPVGRLDYETDGLIILTNDGELANLMMHPSSHLNKTYLVKSPGFLKDEDIKSLQDGVIIDGTYKTAPAILELVSRNHDNSIFYLTIHEGKNRQIRKMLEAISRRVITLTRVQIGPLTIQQLKPGEFRELSVNEVDKIKSLCLFNKANNKYKPHLQIHKN